MISQVNGMTVEPAGTSAASRTRRYVSARRAGSNQGSGLDWNSCHMRVRTSVPRPPPDAGPVAGLSNPTIDLLIVLGKVG